MGLAIEAVRPDLMVTMAVLLDNREKGGLENLLILQVMAFIGRVVVAGAAFRAVLAGADGPGLEAVVREWGVYVTRLIS